MKVISRHMIDYLMTVIACILPILSLGCGKSQQSLHRSILRQILSKQMTENAAGIIYLPKSNAAASCDGCAYVTRNSDGLVLVFFPESRGKNANSAGFLYFSNTPATMPTTVKIIGPNAPLPGGMAAGATRMDVEKTIAPDCAYVKFDLD